MAVDRSGVTCRISDSPSKRQGSGGGGSARSHGERTARGELSAEVEQRPDADRGEERHLGHIDDHGGGFAGQNVAGGGAQTRRGEHVEVAADAEHRDRAVGVDGHHQQRLVLVRVGFVREGAHRSIIASPAVWGRHHRRGATPLATSLPPTHEAPAPA